MTDTLREDLDEGIDQEVIPNTFNRAEFFGGGYPVKLAAFGLSKLPENTPCVFLDLDSIVLGDIAELAKLTSLKYPCYMLNAGSIPFCAVSRWVSLFTRKNWFTTGNSSVVLFHTGSMLNISQAFLLEYSKYNGRGQKHLATDDSFISWYMSQHLRAVPNKYAVMFRREFLSKSMLWSKLKSKLPWIKTRRDKITVITFNGTEFKPKKLLDLAENALITERKGRQAYWNEDTFGPAKARIIAALKPLA